MSDNFEYRVLPREPKLQPIPQNDALPLDDGERKEVEGMNAGVGCLLWIAILIFAGIASSSALAGLVIASIAVAAIAMGIKGSKISDLERRKAQQAKDWTKHTNESEKKGVENEATSLTSQLTRTYDSSTKLVTELSEHLNHASGWLRQAEFEYKENAYAPFWDAVENTAWHLAAFNDKTNQLSKNANEYYRILSGRKHTFPSFPANNNTVIHPSAVVNELRRIVRMGQTNFQFANIWEHRRTREVLMAGFNTLGDAINNLGAKIKYTVSSLQQSISSDLGRLVEEEIKSREALDERMLEQNRMLDNIQQHRKPGARDIPLKR